MSNPVKALFYIFLIICFVPTTFAQNLGVFMSRQDMKWDTLTGYFYDGVMTGNGLLGTVLHRQDAGRGDGNTNKLLFEINRTDLVDSCLLQQEGYSWERKAVGKFAIIPAGRIKHINFKLNLFDAIVSGHLITDKGKASLKFYTHATTQIQVIEYSWESNEKEPKIDFLEDPAGCMLDFVTVDLQEKAKYLSAPPCEKSIESNIHLHKQKLNAGRNFVVAWKILKSKNKITIYHTIEYSHPEAAPFFDAKQLLSNATIGGKNFEKAHISWWQQFYKKAAFISLNDPKYENFYWAQIYKIGSTMREDLQMMDLMGPWYCHTPWRGIWWNWNTQAIYYPLSKINLPQLVNPLIKSLHKYESNLAENLDDELRKYDAIGIGRASSFDLKSKINMNDGPPLYAGREPGNLTWILHTYYEKLMETGEMDEVKEKFYPLLKRAINLYLSLVRKDIDGKYHLPLTMSPEYKPAEDCNYDLALFKWGITTLIEIHDQFKLNDPTYKKWAEINFGLTSFPVSHAYGLKIGKDVDLTESHRHFSHLISIYPLRIYGQNKEEREIAKRSIDHWLSMKEGLAAWSYIVGGGMKTTTYEGDEAKKLLDKSFASFSASTLYREAGQCAETPYMWVKVFTDMLLQMQHDTLKLFPAIPADWKDISFADLRIKGAYLVSAQKRNGKILGFKIFSEKGGTLRLPLINNTTYRIEEANIVERGVDYIQVKFDVGGTIAFSESDRLDYKSPVIVKGGQFNVFGKKKVVVLSKY